MLPDIALRALRHYFGYNSFRPAQERVVEALIAGEDCVAIMPTGAGKSICFQVPALLRKGITLVFTPLISLMKDQVDGLMVQNIPATFLNSSLTNEEFGQRLHEVRAGKVKLLYLAPERLEVEWFRTLLQEMPVAQVIIDEAHCVSQWGHDFRPSYKLIGPFIKTLPHKPIVGAFTATATEEVERDIKQLLGLEEATVFAAGFDRPNLRFSVMRDVKKDDYVLDYVLGHKEDSGVIYCATRKDVEKVYQLLVKAGVKAGYYHGGLADQTRKEQQERYSFDAIQVMVATNAFGMGIDKSNVRYILHYQMPRNMEGYYQEAGRAGRDGGPGECILLYSGRDVMIHKFLIDQGKHAPEQRSLELKRLQQMVDYCFTTECLRAYILKYFGEVPQKKKCHNCSSCLNTSIVRTITGEAKDVFRAISATEERYGIGFIASFLVGAETDRMRFHGYHRLAEFGRLASWSEKDVKELIRLLMADGYIESSGGKYPILSLTPLARDVLEGLRDVQQALPSVAPTTAKARPRARVSSRKGSGLFEHLRKHRKELADKEKVAPFLIFPDTVLIDMVAAKPTTLADLYELKGVGAVKLEKYGLSFLKALSEYKEDL